MRALVFLIRLWPLWLILAVALAGIAVARRGKGGSVGRSSQTPRHGRPREGDPDVAVASPGPARLPASSVAATHPDMGGIQWPPDVTLSDADDADSTLDKEVWRSLRDVLNGQGEGLYADMLRHDGRFRTRDGKRYTLYRATVAFNGLKQPVCVIVRIDMEGHVTARRIIVSLERPEVRFVDEPRDESPTCPKGIAAQQATNVEASGMSPMHTSAVLLLAHTLVQATRYANL